MDHIKNYFHAIAKKIEIEAELAGVSTHNPDVGANREVIINNFLNRHIPKRLSAHLGGQVVGVDGDVSGQIDVVVTNDLSVNFSENDKTFFPVETLASAITIKSTLDKAAMEDCLRNLTSIPEISKEVLSFKLLKLGAIDDFITKHPTYFVFAYNGISAEKNLEYIRQFYKDNPSIPEYKYPKAVIVNRKYMIQYFKVSTKLSDGTLIPEKSFAAIELKDDFDGYPFTVMVHHITEYVDWMSFMTFSFEKYFNKSYGLE
ncbi:DUF6602 domain-containing protein [Vibrio vulnificus]